MRLYERTAEVVKLMDGWMESNRKEMEEGELHGRYTNARKEGRAGARSERSETRSRASLTHTSHLSHTYARYLTTRAFTHTRTPPCTQGVDTHPLLSDDPPELELEHWELERGLGRGGRANKFGQVWIGERVGTWMG